MNEQIVIAGFGGQGVMSAGQLLAFAGMLCGKHVSWLPSYGPEMRGGTANCQVILSDAPVGSPIVSQATAALVLTRPSMDKFENRVIPGGRLLINSSLIDRRAKRTDIDAVYIPANEIAQEIGSSRVANSVMIGAYVAGLSDITIDHMVEAMIKLLGTGKAKWVPLNEAALRRGAKL